MNAGSERLFIGLGAANRRDGGVGLWLGQALAERGAAVLLASRDDEALVEAMDTHSDVVLLDATLSGHAPGTVTRLDATIAPVPVNVFRHPAGSFGAGEVVETARTMGCLPPRLLLIGIEGQDFSDGFGLSPQIERAAQRLLEELSPT